MKQILKISLLLVLVALCAAAILKHHWTSQRQSLGETKKLFSVVTGQLTDFRAAHFESAYQHSAIGIQRKFSPAQFEVMIRRDFSAMIRAGQVEFGVVRVTGATALAEVFLTAPDGSVHIFLYSFSAEADGWKIDGVQSLGTEPARQLPGMHV